MNSEELIEFIKCYSYDEDGNEVEGLGISYDIDENEILPLTAIEIKTILTHEQYLLYCYRM